MQHNDYETEQPRKDDDGSAVQQAPPTLLPTVLHELGLDSPRLLGDQPVDAVGDDIWYTPRGTLPGGEVMWVMRAATVRALGKLGEQAPLEQLLAALEDEHEMVRATAVHAAGL